MGSVSCLKIPRFFYLYGYTRYCGGGLMMESGLIPDISPTYLTNIEPIKVSDTVNVSQRGLNYR